MGATGLVLLDVVLVLAVARALRAGLRRARQPAVMSEVLAGIALGASVLGTLPGDPTSALFPADVREVLLRLGQVGVAGYLFAVGARLERSALRREGSVATRVAVTSFAVPWGAGVLLALLIHPAVSGDPPRLAFALFLGTALAVTAFPVLARIVDERGLAERPAGRVALAAAAGQELLVWPILALAVALGGDGDRSVPVVLGLAVLGVALVLLLARVVVPVLATRLPGAAGVVVLVGLGLAAAATELTGLHLVLGAFLFGAALPAAPRTAGLALLGTRPATLASAALLPLFFALPALRVDVWALGLRGVGLFALVLVVAATAKLASAALAARRGGLAREEALTVGVLMNARGLVELVVLGVGLEAGLIDVRLFTAMVLMALATTFAAGPLVDAVARRASDRRPGPPAAVAA